MFWDLKNKVVVVTGGAHGIGYNIADKYLQEGAKTIIILDINEVNGIEAEKNLNMKYGNEKAIFIKCDVATDVEDVSKNIFNTYEVDVLVNSAGIINEVVPKETIDVNITGVISWSKKLWQHMRKGQGGNGGTIINISSVAGFRTYKYFPTYEASKHAVVSFSKSLGHVDNYKKSGVRVIALCPGATETGIPMDGMFWDDDIRDEIEKLLILQIWQNVDVVGDAAVEIYKNANSGTIWMIEDAKPIVEVAK